MNRNKFLGLELVNGSMNEVLDEVEVFLSSDEVDMGQKFLFTPNPEMFVEANRNPRFFEVLQRANWLLPDGVGILMWSKILWGTIFENRLTGVDFFKAFIEVGKHKVFLLGGVSGAAEVVAGKSANVVGYYDGFVNDENLDDILNAINLSEAEVVFVGLGAPKQEFWIAENCKKLKHVKLFAGIGGAIDFVAGKQLRAPKLMQRLSLEWLYRLIRQPSRFIRIWNAVVVFSWLCVKSKIISSKV